MDISSLGSQLPPSVSVSDRSTGGILASQATKNVAPVQTSHPVTPAGQAKPSPSKEQVTKAVENINKTIQAASQNLEFSVDQDSSQVIVKVIDQQTKQVLRQIPTEEILEIAKSLDKLQGLLIKQTA